MPASPQPAEPLQRSSGSYGCGAKSGNRPSLACASRRSAVHLVKNAAMSMFIAAVWLNTCMSPVQPNRSSRCGQSVGTPIRLSRWVHRMLANSRLSIGLEHSNVPTSGADEQTTQPVSVSSVGALLNPVTSTNWNP